MKFWPTTRTAAGFTSTATDSTVNLGSTAVKFSSEGENLMLLKFLITVISINDIARLFRFKRIFFFNYVYWEIQIILRESLSIKTKKNQSLDSTNSIRMMMNVELKLLNIYPVHSSHTSNSQYLSVVRSISSNSITIFADTIKTFPISLNISNSFW